MTSENASKTAATHQEKLTWLNTRSAENESELSIAKRKSFVFSWIRFLTFVMMPIGAYAAISEDYLIGGILIGVGLIGFLISVRIHSKVRERVQLATLTKVVLEESAVRLSGSTEIIRDGQVPPDTDLQSDNEDSWTLSPQEIVDFDVFGSPLSLFGLLNRTSTPTGARHLAYALTHPLKSADKIRDVQHSVKWLTENPEERVRMMAAAAGMRSLSTEFDGFISTVKDSTPLPNESRIRGFQFWSILGLGIIGFVVYRLIDKRVTPLEWIALGGVLMVNTSILRSLKDDVLARIRPWLPLDDAVSQFAFMVNEIEADLPVDGRLGEIKNALGQSLEPPVIPALERVIPFAFLGLAGLLHTIVNYLTLWDLHVVRGLDKSAVRHRELLIDVFNSIAELELYASLGAYAWEMNGTSYPQVEVRGQDLCIEIEEGRHPLIPAGETVANDVSLGEPIRTYVITGSNMSGKSTFLRMSACNVLMAQIGAAVPARSMRLTPVRLMSDLRIRDDLARHESYFLAEVRQVRRMVEAAQSHEPILALIDEPFRGTNSAERVGAALAVVRALSRGGGLHMVATHDEAITALAEAATVENYHFSERFDSEELVFDYKIQTGASQTRNALRVLEAEGFPVELVKEAKEAAKRLLQDQ